jgi:hypothetical protein
MPALVAPPVRQTIRSFDMLKYDKGLSANSFAAFLFVWINCSTNHKPAAAAVAAESYTRAYSTGSGHQSVIGKQSRRALQVDAWTHGQRAQTATSWQTAARCHVPSVAHIFPF